MTVHTRDDLAAAIIAAAEDADGDALVDLIDSLACLTEVKAVAALAIQALAARLGEMTDGDG